MDCIIIFTACVCAAVKLHACCRYRDFFCPLLAVEVWSSQTSVCSCPSFTPPTPSVFFSIYCVFLSFCLHCVYHRVYYTTLDTIITLRCFSLSIQKIQLQLQVYVSIVTCVPLVVRLGEHTSHCSPSWRLQQLGAEVISTVPSYSQHCNTVTEVFRLLDQDPFKILVHACKYGLLKQALYLEVQARVVCVHL